MNCLRFIGTTAPDTLCPLGAGMADQVHDNLMASGVYDLPAGFFYDQTTLTVYDQKGRPQPFRTAQLRHAVALEKAFARSDETNLRAIEQSKAQGRAAFRAAGRPIPDNLAPAPGFEDPPETNSVLATPYVVPSPAAPVAVPQYATPAPVNYAPAYSAPLSTLPAPVLTAPPSAPDPVQEQARREAAAAAQAAQLVAQYTPFIGQARSYASQLSAAGRSAEAGQWLDYSTQLAQWVQQLRTTYNVN